MLKKGHFKTFFHLSHKMKLLVWAAFILLGVMRFLLLMIPFRRLSSLMGHEYKESPSSLSDEQYAKASSVGWAIEKVSNHTPWQSKCLVRALSAQLILKMLHIPNTLYLGLTKDEKNHLIAHAWLRTGKCYITGWVEKDKYQAVTFFSYP